MRRLVTESEVNALPRDSRLEVTADTLFTPSARDAAFLRRITIVQPGDRQPVWSLGANSERCPTCELHKLEDGRYLVEVRGGRLLRIVAQDPSAG